MLGGHPRIEPTAQRTRAQIPVPVQQSHRLRSRRFVRTRAVNDDLPIARAGELAGFDFVEMHDRSAGNPALVELVCIAAANVDQLDRLARVNQGTQLGNVDARYADRERDAPAPPAPSDVKHKQRRRIPAASQPNIEI